MSVKDYPQTMKRVYAVFFALLAVTCFLAGCGTRARQEKFEQTALYFDTVINISFYAGENGNELMERCMQMCRQFENTFSRTEKDSELYKINHRETERVEVSEDIAELVSVGLEYYEKTDGKFDITVAPLADLWDFKNENAQVPDPQAVRETLKKVDAGKVHIEGNTLVFDSPDTMLDLGALAKGYAADAIKEFLVGAGVQYGLLNLGGNVLTIGTRPDKKEWNIGIRKPFADYSETALTVKVTDKTVVSSGTYERFFEQDGRIYHHILDPDTGYPVENDIEGVSVICDSSLMGDALSTACLAIGQEAASKLIEQTAGAEAVFILKDSQIVYTDETMKE